MGEEEQRRSTMGTETTLKNAQKPARQGRHTTGTLTGRQICLLGGAGIGVLGGRVVVDAALDCAHARDTSTLNTAELTTVFAEPISDTRTGRRRGTVRYGTWLCSIIAAS